MCLVGVGGADDGVVNARGFPGFAIPVEAGADLPVFVWGVTGGEFDLVGGDVGVDAFAAAVFGAVVAVAGVNKPAVFDFAADANFPAVVFGAVFGAVIVGIGVVRVGACLDGYVVFASLVEGEVGAQFAVQPFAFEPDFVGAALFGVKAAVVLVFFVLWFVDGAVAG